MANGQTGRRPWRRQTARYGDRQPDIVAADSYATTLFGMRPEDIGYIPAAAAMGLGAAICRA